MADDGELQTQMDARNNEVSNFLTRKDKASALKACLANPPVATKNEAIKDGNTAIVEKVLGAITDSEIATLVGGLSMDQCDVLMKYVFKLMGKNSNCGGMLKFHAQLVEKAGLGAIVRVMTDRKQV